MPRRILQGEVVSNKSDKTIVVKVERTYKHPLYKKYIKKDKKYSAHEKIISLRLVTLYKFVNVRPNQNKNFEVFIQISFN